MRRYGFAHIPTYLAICGCGEHREWHKHLYIGGKISPIDWLTLFSRHAGDISPQALKLFDRGCGSFVDMINSGGTEVTDL